MNFFAKILITSLAVILVSYLLPGVKIDGMLTAIIVALVLAFLNTFIKPLMIILTIPVTIFTLGLFLLAINAFLILIADYFVDGFHVNSFWWALLFSFLLFIVVSVLEGLTKSKSSETE